MVFLNISILQKNYSLFSTSLDSHFPLPLHFPSYFLYLDYSLPIFSSSFDCKLDSLYSFSSFSSMSLYFTPLSYCFHSKCSINHLIVQESKTYGFLILYCNQSLSTSTSINHLHNSYSIYICYSYE